VNPQQHFWDLIYAWSLGLGFILAIVLICFIGYWVDQRKLKNPFGPFIRAFDKWQDHRMRISRIRLRAELTRNGTDADYVDYLEKKEGIK
jgi:hypothetical protein